MSARRDESVRGAGEVAAAAPQHREWDADGYQRLSDPQLAWARQMLERLPLRGDERVLDAGCGTGRVTRLLVERLPQGHIVGVDASAAMIERARAELPDGVELVHADVVELELSDPVDLVFSNATFHWIMDHDALFARLRALLGPNGRLVAQCGGEGNLRRVLAVVEEVMRSAPYAQALRGFRRAWRFAGPQETEATLARTGFAEAHCWLSDGAVTPGDPREYLATVVLRTHLESLPLDLRTPFMDAVMERLGAAPTLDYVRLNIEARGPG